ncbi:MAG: DinB family protein [Gemmatimonadaceae bacterium]
MNETSTPRAIAPDIREVLDQLVAADRDAEALTDGLSEQQATRRLTLGSWSVAECLDHLATANRVYVAAMREPARRARSRGLMRARPATPGFFGGLFVASQEPPPRWWSKLRAPRKIRPRASPPLADAFAAFMASQVEAREFFTVNADLDLATISFPNPFVPGIRFSLATGLHVIAAHDRRHLSQAWRVRRALESGGHEG